MREDALLAKCEARHQGYVDGGLLREKTCAFVNAWYRWKKKIQKTRLVGYSPQCGIIARSVCVRRGEKEGASQCLLRRCGVLVDWEKEKENENLKFLGWIIGQPPL